MSELINLNITKIKKPLVKLKTRFSKGSGFIDDKTLRIDFVSRREKELKYSFWILLLLIYLSYITNVASNQFFLAYFFGTVLAVSIVLRLYFRVDDFFIISLDDLKVYKCLTHRNKKNFQVFCDLNDVFAMAIDMQTYTVNVGGKSVLAYKHAVTFVLNNGYILPITNYFDMGYFDAIPYAKAIAKFLNKPCFYGKTYTNFLSIQVVADSLPKVTFKN